MSRLKRELTGLGPVLRFSFIQLFKARGNIITLCVFLLLSLVGVPAYALFTSRAPAPQAEYEYASPAPDTVEDGRLSVSYSIVSQGGESDGGGGYLMQLAYSVGMMVVSMMSVSYIIGAVAEEKTSRLVELLMVSVKPLALIVGKILSVMLYMLLFFALIAVCLAASNALSAQLFGVCISLPAGADGASAPAGVGLGDAAAVLVSLLLGYFTFAIAAGLFGAGCSTTEDTQSAVGGCTTVIMLSYLLSVMVGSMSGPLCTACCLLPVLSVFCAPVQYALGQLSLPLLCLSWLLQAVCVALLAALCARIYALLLIYRGSRIKLRTMLSMARGGGRGAV